MLFNSYIFVLFFLPVTLIGYFGLNKLKLYDISKVFLTLMSLYFYAYFNLNYLLIILSSIIINFVLSKFFRTENKKIKILCLIIGVSFNIGILFYFKYFDFFIININYIFAADFSLKHLLLPLGISFFTFQQLSYVIDCYKDNVEDYKFIDYALFVTYFPQLIAGPIVLHSEIIPQFNDENKKRFSYENMNVGIYAFSIGLAKKVLIADTLGNVVNVGFSSIEGLGTIMAVIVILCYTFQIYFDFSGYCDMALGLGKMFNIDIPINFNSPYKALDIQDFWRRWHMTLSRFLTNYLYIPLGGNRKGNLRTYINTFIVFLVSGIWHGANYTFIIWGIFHGVAMCINKFIKQKKIHIPSPISWVITFGFINFTWIFFRANSISDAIIFIKEIFSFNFRIDVNILGNLIRNEFTYPLQIYGIPTGNAYFMLILTVVILLSLLSICLFTKNTFEKSKTFTPNIFNLIVVVILLVWSITSFAGVSTFLYFNF